VETLKPLNESQLIDVIQSAMTAKTPLEVVGGGSKRAFGRPVAAERLLDLSALSGITLYEPSELVMTAAAATPLAEIVQALDENNQYLAFEPQDMGSILGDGNGSTMGGTIGGVIACNLAGPRRIKSGAARDHILGFKAVSGRGQAFKSGGRVVKNVTGFDLSKLITGSFGTLAAISEVSFKVLPRPQTTRTVLIFGGDAENARRIMSLALNGPFEVSAAAHLPADVAAASIVDLVAAAGRSLTALRLEGPEPSVAHRCRTLQSGLSAETEELDEANSRRFWRQVRDAAFFAAVPDAQIWRLSVPPAAGAGVAAEILDRIDGRAFFDWGGGLLWLAIAPRRDAGASVVRGAIGEGGGHATLIRADVAIRNSLAVFQPQPPALAALTARIKDAFDPEGILNPGRMA
jgi:glycolate oxidase FAD binding subunit